MADMFSVQQRSVIMGRIRSRGNQATELEFIRLLRKHRISGWRRGSSLPGKPDFVFAACRLVVFIDGDFWHGNPRKFRLPKSNMPYWTEKILGNRRRDRRINRVLRADGWHVVRFWQSSLINEARTVRRLRQALETAIAKQKRALDEAAPGKKNRRLPR
jgi:DNA mismatch endonuclease, patch repair protein